MESVRETWEKALGKLQIQVNKANYSTWLSNSQGVSYQDNIFVVGVPNVFIAEWLSKHLHSLIRENLADIIGKDVDVKIVVHNQEGLPTSPLTYASQPDGGTSTKARWNRFNPRFTFDSFVVSDCNRLAYAAAIAVAENPGRTYNPLVIYSKTGLGKTHLLHAIGHVALNNGYRVAYKAADQFAGEFVLSIKQKEVESFRTLFRDIHALLFDDIQFLYDKKQSLQCFFQIFNELYNSGVQIVLTADCPPKDMTSLIDKLRSRLQWGLAVPISPPDLETRLAILRAKARAISAPLSGEALQIIGEKFHDNVRQLEGALAYVTAHATLSGVDITPQIINKLLTTTVNQDTGRIIQIVADYFGLTTKEIISRKRDKNVVTARQIAMHLMRENDNLSFARIGKVLGNRSHATVLYSCEKVAGEIKINQNLARQMLELQEKINSHKTLKEGYQDV